MRKISGLAGIVILILIMGMPMRLHSQEKGVIKAKGSKAKDTLLVAFKKMLDVNGYHFEGEMKMEMNSAGATIKTDMEMEGIHKKPDSDYIKMNVMNMDMEMYRVGDQIAMKNPQSGEWMMLPAEMMQNQMMPIEQIQMVEKYLKDTKFLGEEVVEGKRCKVIESSLDKEGLLKMMKKQGNLMAFDPDNINLPSPPTYKVWIGKDDLLVYKMVMTMEMSMGKQGAEEDEEDEEDEWDDEEESDLTEMSMKMSMEVNIYDYNKDLKIVLPDEVTKLFAGEEDEEEEEWEDEEE